MADFKNEFSWSKSRDQTFKECNKKYFFNHYEFWDGWSYDANDRTKRIYYLKQLLGKEMWIGQVIHDVIEHVLKKYRVDEKLSMNYAIFILEKKLKSQYIASQIKDYGKFPSKITKLFEHEYNIEISEEQKNELFCYAKKCIMNFYNSDIFMEIRKSDVKDWVLLEDFLKFDFEGDIVFLKIDFAIKKGDEIILYDWKTGRERVADFDLQMAIYSLYISENFKISPEKIVARVLNLSIDKADDFRIDCKKLEETKDYIRKSILNMKSKLDSIENNYASEDNFERKEGYHCSRCNYRKVCKGEWSNYS